MKISKELLEELYVKKGLSQQQVAKEVGLSQSAIGSLVKKYELKEAKKKQTKINKLYPKNGKRWDSEEIDLLESLYGVVSYKVLCGRLKRSKRSIENQKNKLKLGKLIEATENITSNELARALGRAPCTIRTWVNDRQLPAIRKVLKEQRKYYRIDIKEFWKWAKDNPLMDWTKYELGNLPNEPNWVLEEKKKATPRLRKEWNKTDDTLLEFYYKQGCTIKEIAKKLNRTFKSIDMRLIKLNIKRKQPKLVWQPIEVNTMLDMVDEEKTFIEIAEELGRSYKSVTTKYLLIKNMSEKINV